MQKLTKLETDLINIQMKLKLKEELIVKLKEDNKKANKDAEWA